MGENYKESGGLGWLVIEFSSFVHYVTFPSSISDSFLAELCSVNWLSTLLPNFCKNIFYSFIYSLFCLFHIRFYL